MHAAEFHGRRQAFACDFKGCNALFRTHEDLNRHKVAIDSEHEFCTICNQGFKDWTTFAQHKVQSSKHICCPVCAADFKSESGRERHINLAHQKDQHLVCLGCTKIFTRAAALIRHMEEGKCEKISQEQFKTNLYRKEVLSDMLNDPYRGEEPTYASSEAGDTEHGGVPLMDQTDPVEEGRAKSFASLQPTLSSASSNAAGTPSRASSVDGAWEKPIAPSGSISGSQTIDDYGKSVASLSSAFGRTVLTGSTVQTSKDKGMGKAAGFSADLSTKRSQASSSIWTGGSETASKLFSGASLSAVPANNSNAAVFAAGLRQRKDDFANTYGVPTSSVAKESVDEAKPYNLLRATEGFYDPSWEPNSENYSPEKFFNQAIQLYECPHQHCTFTAEKPDELTAHLHDPTHSVRKRKCPGCLRTFKSATALISHCESASTRCNIRNSEQYDRVIGQISGGFLMIESEAARRSSTGKGGENARKEKEWEKGMVTYKASKPAGM